MAKKLCKLDFKFFSEENVIGAWQHKTDYSDARVFWVVIRALLDSPAWWLITGPRYDSGLFFSPSLYDFYIYFLNIIKLIINIILLSL